MNYQETVGWMFAQLPMYQRQGASAFKKDLTNTLHLSQHLNFPEKKFKSIHVAGSNGKGSVSHMLASILQEAGYTVGLYTSPHLKDFRERIKINGKVVNKQFVIGFIERNKAFLETHKLSFFEMTVGMAFDYFAKQNVDVAVIEVGLGGRLDSTNIITPVTSVITNISLEHTQMLGNTLDKIAYEKAGIIKPNIPVVIGEKHEETTPVFTQIALEKHAEISYAEDAGIQTLPSDLIGPYQKKNIQTVLATIPVLKGKKFKISEKNIKAGLLHVVKNTGLKGRWQILNNSPKVVCDTAHNPAGLKYVFDQIKLEHFNELHLVFGVVNDKDLDSLAPFLPQKAKYYFCKPDVPRGLEASVLKERMKVFGVEGDDYESVGKAYHTALQRAHTDDFIFIGGSTFVVAEII